MRQGFGRIAALCMLAAWAFFAPAPCAFAAKQKAAPPVARTPASKGECIVSAQAFYRYAKSLSRKKKIPREFIRVVSDLDESCGEEDFTKARISIDWMSGCLKNFSVRENQACSRHKDYLCAMNAKSDACLRAP
jgi:hypothetical protein